jgi:hypothetical protein
MLIEELDSMCPDKDTDGNNLTDTITNNNGTVLCIYTNGICYYDVNTILLHLIESL